METYYAAHIMIQRLEKKLWDIQSKLNGEYPNCEEQYKDILAMADITKAIQHLKSALPELRKLIGDL